MITADQKDTLKKYAEIKNQIKLWEVQAEALNPEVLQIMALNDVEEIDLEEKGKLTLGSRRTWKYTESTLDLKAKFDEAKKFEEQTGAAEYVEKKYVIFKSNGTEE